MLRNFLLCISLSGALAGCAVETSNPDKSGGDLDSLIADTNTLVGAASADSARRPTLMGEIEFGESLEGSFARDARFLAWSFAAESGTKLVLAAEGAEDPDLDTVLFLYRATASGNPTGRALATNDDIDGGLSSLLQLEAPATGRYVALVRRYDGGDSGSVLLSLTAPGRICGTRGAAACEEGEYCAYPADAMCGRADAPGTCEAKPTVCTREFIPVCGCDGNTYSNACNAAAAGVSVEKEGACDPAPQVCGTRGAPASCGEGQFCEYPEGAGCGRADGPGSCQEKPTACPRHIDPVCGCDGNTYGNACNARARGVSVDYEGPCVRAGETCGGLLGSSCGEDEYCDYAIEAMCGAADQTGTCRARPNVCTREFIPVCGCDGNTYGNACGANAAGTSVASEGPCAD